MRLTKLDISIFIDLFVTGFGFVSMLVFSALLMGIL